MIPEYQINAGPRPASAIQMAQFLPICDLMFNLISMVAYFCDTTFNIIALFILYSTSSLQQWAYIGFVCMSMSSFLCQIVSLRWSLKAHLYYYKNQIDLAHTQAALGGIGSGGNATSTSTTTTTTTDNDDELIVGSDHNRVAVQRHHFNNNNNIANNNLQQFTTVNAHTVSNLAPVHIRSQSYSGPCQANTATLYHHTSHAHQHAPPPPFNYNLYAPSHASNLSAYAPSTNHHFRQHSVASTVDGACNMADSSEFLPATGHSTTAGSTVGNATLDPIARIKSRYYMAILLECIVHCIQCGVLFRYIRLVLPVADDTRVKRDARDLCILRMIHAFCQSAPLLLIQLYIIWYRPSPELLQSSSVTSVALSLFSVCWALASFTKYSRTRYLHHFVLTWPGVISQLLWRLGTVSSRCVALTFYAVHYGYWIILALALHWGSMFLWLLLPSNMLRDDDNVKRPKRLAIAMITAWVYCFCYINFEKHNSKQKMFLFYLLMFLENNLLLSVCLGFSPYLSWTRSISVLTVYLGFLVGITFMLLYYRLFHVNVINADRSASDDSLDSIADHLSPAGKKIIGYKSGTISISGNHVREQIVSHLSSHNQPQQGHYYGNNLPVMANSTTKLPGVFSCRLNSALSKFGPTTNSSETSWKFLTSLNHHQNGAQFVNGGRT